MNEELKKEIAAMVVTAVSEATKQITEVFAGKFEEMKKSIEDNADASKDKLNRDLSEEEIAKLSEEERFEYFNHKSALNFVDESKNGSPLGGKSLDSCQGIGIQYKEHDETEGKNLW